MIDIIKFPDLNLPFNLTLWVYLLGIVQLILQNKKLSIYLSLFIPSLLLFNNINSDLFGLNTNIFIFVILIFNLFYIFIDRADSIESKYLDIITLLTLSIIGLIKSKTFDSVIYNLSILFILKSYLIISNKELYKNAKRTIFLELSINILLLSLISAASLILDNNFNISAVDNIYQQAIIEKPWGMLSCIMMFIGFAIATNSWPFCFSNIKLYKPLSKEFFLVYCVEKAVLTLLILKIFHGLFLLEVLGVATVLYSIIYGIYNRSNDNNLFYLFSFQFSIFLILPIGDNSINIISGIICWQLLPYLSIIILKTYLRDKSRSDDKIVLDTIFLVSYVIIFVNLAVNLVKYSLFTNSEISYGLKIFLYTIIIFSSLIIPWQQHYLSFKKEYKNKNITFYFCSSFMILNIFLITVLNYSLIIKYYLFVMLFLILSVIINLFDQRIKNYSSIDDVDDIMYKVIRNINDIKFKSIKKFKFTLSKPDFLRLERITKINLSEGISAAIFSLIVYIICTS